LIHHIWLEQNNTEHDSAGCPELRRKEKLIETIQGESKQLDFNIYTEHETTKENLVLLPVDNLKMITIYLKNAKADKRIQNSK
jgi:hypothetical protein